MRTLQQAASTALVSITIFATTLAGASNAPTGGPVTSIVQDPGNPRVLYVSTDGGGIFTSADAGVTWESRNYGLTRVHATALAIDPLRPNILYAATGDELRRSDDGGRSWPSGQCCYAPRFSWLEMKGSELQAAQGNRVRAFDAEDLDFESDSDLGARVNRIAVSSSIFAATDQGLYHSVGDGVRRTYTKVLDGPMTAVVVDRIDSHRLYAAGSRSDQKATAFFRTLDGDRWSALPDLPGMVTAVTAGHERARPLYAATESGALFVLKEDVASATWEQLFASSRTITALFQTSDDYLYAGTADSQVLKIPAASGPDSFSLTPLADDAARLPRLLTQLQNRRLADDELASGVLIPIAGEVAGAGGELFRTDVSLLNAAATAQDVIVIWIPAGGGGRIPPAFKATLPALTVAGSAITITDFVRRLGLSGLGSIAVVAVDATGNVSPASSISGNARVWSQKTGIPGSTSQTIEAVSLSSLRAEARIAIGTRQDGDFRTNIGIVNLDSVPHEYEVSIRGERFRSSFTVRLEGGSMMQKSAPQGDYGTLTVVVETKDSHDWSSYATTIDNASGDSWLARGVALHLPR